MWPSSPLVSFVAGTTPWISADVCNSLQSGINGIINGTYSLSALVVDGTGGSVVSPRAGTGTVSAALTGTGQPTPTVALGQWGKGGVPLGWVQIKPDGTYNRGYNVYQTTRPMVGNYLVTFNCSPSDPLNSVVLVSPGEYDVRVSGFPTSIGGKQSAQILTLDFNGFAKDAHVNVLVFGE